MVNYIPNNNEDKQKAEFSEKRHSFFIVTRPNGYPEIVGYPVMKEEWLRIQDALLDYSQRTKGVNRFYSFHTIDGREVFLNSEEIEYLHFLCDPVHKINSEDYYAQVKLFFKGRTSADDFYCEDSDMIYDFGWRLAFDDSDQRSYQRIRDEDSEDLFVNIDRLIIAEFSAKQINEGRKNSEEENMQMDGE